MLVGTGLLGIDEAVVAETVPKQQNETSNFKIIIQQTGRQSNIDTVIASSNLNYESMLTRVNSIIMHVRCTIFNYQETCKQALSCSAFTHETKSI